MILSRAANAWERQFRAHKIYGPKKCCDRGASGNHQKMTISGTATKSLERSLILTYIGEVLLATKIIKYLCKYLQNNHFRKVSKTLPKCKPYANPKETLCDPYVSPM